jgi:hypothetical protein
MFTHFQQFLKLLAGTTKVSSSYLKKNMGCFLQWKSADDLFGNEMAKTGNKTEVKIFCVGVKGPGLHLEAIFK